MVVAWDGGLALFVGVLLVVARICSKIVLSSSRRDPWTALTGILAFAAQTCPAVYPTQGV